MGVDTVLRLPVGTQIGDVANAIGILLGKKKHWMALTSMASRAEERPEPVERGYVEVEGVSFTTSDRQPGCVTINIADSNNILGGGWWFFYHFEGKYGGPEMRGGARPARITLHRRLAFLFGGTVDYQDCDSVEVDYKQGAPAWTLRSHEDEFFYQKQLDLWNTTPLTKAEIKQYSAAAAYTGVR